MEGPKGTVREGGKQRDLRRMFKMLRKVWLNIRVKKMNMHKGVTIKVLLDSSITGIFIDRKMTAKYGFRLQKLERLVVVKSIDGTNNSVGVITHQVKANIYYKNHIERMWMDVYDLEKTDVILGILWLQVYNPEINQEIGEVEITRCLPLCKKNTKLKEEKRAKKGKRVATLEEEKIVRQTVDNKKNWEREEKVEVDHRKIKEIVLQKFLKWKKVFEKVKSKRMPTRKIWDHTIDLKEMFKLQKERIYSLSKNKREEIQNFVNDQLRKRYIRLSKFPQTLLVFFISKKDRSKRIVMDYCNLNKQTVKNNYLLLLIIDLIDNIESKRVFTKMNLQWGFNNVRIKKGNKWKGAFTIHVGLFEPIVMFFGITNSPATFQTIINKILKDLVNKGKITVCIDDVLIGTRTEKGYNKIVEEVLRRLEKNDLYVKPEKCI